MQTQQSRSRGRFKHTVEVTCGNNITELWHPLCCLYGADKQLYPSLSGCFGGGGDAARGKRNGNVEEGVYGDAGNVTCQLFTMFQMRCKGGAQRVQRKKKSNCGKKMEKNRDNKSFCLSCERQPRCRY